MKKMMAKKKQLQMSILICRIMNGKDPKQSMRVFPPFVCCLWQSHGRALRDGTLH